MGKVNGSLLVIKEQTINDVPISGLQLQFRKSNYFTILTVYGDFEYGNRDFYFDAKGEFAGTGTAVGQCPSEGS